MRKFTSSFVAALVLLTGACKVEDPSEPAPVVKTYPDCENVEFTPCVTFDEGEWRVVTDYNPYTSYKIREPKRVGDKFQER